MRRRALGWAAFWTAATAIFLAGDKGGWSLCSVIRWLFHTDTPEGRVAFNAVYGAGAETLRQHILNQPVT